MSRLFRIALITGLVGGLTGVAWAQDSTETDDEGRKVVYKQKTEIDFEGLDVNGELVKPQSALVLDRKKANFNPEMEQSIDEVK